VCSTDDNGWHRVNPDGLQGLPGLRAPRQGDNPTGDGDAGHGPFGLRQSGPVLEDSSAYGATRSRQLHSQHRGYEAGNNEQHYYGKCAPSGWGWAGVDGGGRLPVPDLFGEEPRESKWRRSLFPSLSKKRKAYDSRGILRVARLRRGGTQ
jgi:hypothetical protein